MKNKVSWFKEEQDLIKWFKKYVSARTKTKHEKFYTDLLFEIDLGPQTPRARSGELYRGLLLMKHLVDDLKRKEFQDILDQKGISDERRP